eukprot:14759413-Alexandrium_andersonii.AAC.1
MYGDLLPVSSSFAGVDCCNTYAKQLQALGIPDWRDAGADGADMPRAADSSGVHIRVYIMGSDQ